MSIHMVKLTQREEVADRTMAFHFEKPEGFLYKAGQFADFTLIDPPKPMPKVIYEDFLWRALHMKKTSK